MPATNTMPHEASQLLERCVNTWSLHQPTSFSWTTGLFMPGVENLTEEGIHQGLDAFRELLRFVEQSPQRDRVGALFHAEMKRAVLQKIHQLESHLRNLIYCRPYDTIIAMKLVQLRRLNGDLPGDVVKEGLRNIRQIFVEKRRRYDRGDLLVSDSDAVVSARLAEAFDELAVQWREPSRAGEVARVMSSPDTVKRANVSPSRKLLVMAGHNQQRSLQDWIELLSSLIQDDIQILNDLQGTRDGLAEVNVQQKWDAAAWFTEPESKHLGSPLLWTHHVLQTLGDRLGRVLPLSTIQVVIRRSDGIIDTIAPEALYLADRKTAGLFLNWQRDETEGPMPRRQLLYLAFLVAHELVPGHHTQYAGFDETQAFLMDPYGSEGWAVYAERFVTQIDPSAAAVLSYQRIRRLLPCLLTLFNVVSGKEEVRDYLSDLCASCPSLAAEVRRPNFLRAMRHSNLTYGIGLAETEAELRRLRRDVPASVTDYELYSAFLAPGPISTRAAAQLARYNLSGVLPERA